MKKIMMRFFAVLLVMAILSIFSGCSIDELAANLVKGVIDHVFEYGPEEAAEDEKAFQSLERTRMENGREIPDPPADVSDIRMTILDREYETVSLFDDKQVLSMMQICYGYYADGMWHDYPSENYNLIGIFKHADEMGWEAGKGSHMVKIGTYLLICVCLQDDPLEQHVITDSLNSQVKEPFAQYRTYCDYYDAEGQQHYYSENHESGYGYIAENPHYGKEGEEIRLHERMEFPARYYIILDYTTLADDYELNVSVIEWDDQISEDYKLTGKEIKDLIG